MIIQVNTSYKPYYDIQESKDYKKMANDCKNNTVWQLFSVRFN